MIDLSVSLIFSLAISLSSITNFLLSPSLCQKALRSMIINAFRNRSENGDTNLMIIVSRVSRSGHRIIGGTYERPIKSGRARTRTAEQ